MTPLREHNESKLFAVMPKADRSLAVAWWVVLILRDVLPAFLSDRYDFSVVIQVLSHKPTGGFAQPEPASVIFLPAPT